MHTKWVLLLQFFFNSASYPLSPLDSMHVGEISIYYAWVVRGDSQLIVTILVSLFLCPV